MINMRLARERGLGEGGIEAIKATHEVLNEMLSSGQVGSFSHDMYDNIEACEYLLQDLWGFPKDPAFHTWKHRYNFKCQWAGRKFRCTRTGEEFIIPNSVEERDYFSFGDSAIDVGRIGCYCRIIGDVVEITEEGNED